MKRLLLCLCLCLLMPLNVFASSVVDFTPPYYSLTYNGVSGSIEVPFSGYYTLTAAGAQGATYGSTRQKGVKLSCDIWLNKGDVLRYSCKTYPNNYTTSGSTLSIPAGNGCSVQLNDTPLLYAAPGFSTTKSNPVPSGINKVLLHQSGSAEPKQFDVHWHVGNGTTNTECYRVTTCGGRIMCDGSDPIYGADGSIVDYEDTDNRYYCKECGKGYGTYPDDDDPGPGVSRCNKVTGSTIICGYAQGQIKDLYNLTYAASLYPVGTTVTNNSNAGNGYFTIQLKQVNNIPTDNILLDKIFYQNFRYNIVVYEDTVVYCKHGNLN